MPKGYPKNRPPGNPNIRGIGKATRYKKGDTRAAENGKKGGNVGVILLKTVREFAEDTLNAENQRVLEGVVKRIIKMAVDGNLPAIQYLFKIIGQDPGDTVTIKGASLSDEAKKEIDRLLEETRGEVK